MTKDALKFTKMHKNAKDAIRSTKVQSGVLIIQKWANMSLEVLGRSLMNYINEHEFRKTKTERQKSIDNKIKREKWK